MPVPGLHHVTATVDAAQPDLDVCLDGLADEDVTMLGGGLRLPPWEAPHRADTEASLVSIRYS